MSEWELALEQQTDLTVTDGTLANIAGAVRRGADLRLYMTTPDYEETIYFQQTYAGAGTLFAGLMSHHHGYSHHGTAIDQPISSIFKYDVSGTFSHVKWMWGDVALDESQAFPYGIYRWFVCDRWRTIYEHDAQGNRIAGDLEELQDAARQGRTIQVGIRQLFGLAEDDDAGPEHISFVTTIQPLIRGGHVQSNCDLVVVGAPRWPFTWKDGVHVGTMLTSTTGEILTFLTQPGKLPFQRLTRRRAMQWMVAEHG